MSLEGGASAEKLRPIAERTCREVIGYDEGSIIAAATQCIGQSKDYYSLVMTHHFSSKFHSGKGGKGADAVFGRSDDGFCESTLEKC